MVFVDTPRRLQRQPPRGARGGGPLYPLQLCALNPLQSASAKCLGIASPSSGVIAEPAPPSVPTCSAAVAVSRWGSVPVPAVLRCPRFIPHPSACVRRRMSEQGKGSASASAAAPAPGSDTYKGWLFKWTNYLKGYQRRWFVLSNGLLSYYRYMSPDAGAVLCHSARPPGESRFRASQLASSRLQLAVNRSPSVDRWLISVSL
ncbi:Oxysterol-binding protein 2 [Liparis tanakae]|uniref:Oxysterol-binding protein 2 n=1 Tax=Liparis tanakae TaxID=230148 RepID=A0A4Z2GHI9_9TELE|nr:Oxysterol-binding protein 2 [Liparis tanakae]